MGRHKVNLLTKLLISYLLVLMFPVLIILLYYYPQSAAAVRAKEMDWNAHITEQFMTSMDTFTRYVYNLPFELVQNRELRLYQAEESDYQRVLIANEMKKYNATDAFIYNTLLYVRDIGMLFSKTGSAYSLEDMATPGIGFTYEIWQPAYMKETLNTLDTPLVRPVEEVIIPGNNRVRMLTFLQPLPVGGSHSPGVVMILVKEDTILHMMRSVSEHYFGDFFILNEQGQPLVASNGSLVRSSDDLASLVDRMERENSGDLTSGIHQINGITYIVSYAVSDKNGWKYFSLLPLTESLQDLRAIQLKTALLVGFILLLEVIVIYISIRNNYHPIKRLVEFATGLFEPQQQKPMNELETIRYTLSGLSAANSRLDEEVKGALPLKRDNLLLELVNGHFHAWEPFAKEAAKFGIVLDGEFLTAVVISCHAGTEAAHRIWDICRSEEERFPAGTKGYFFKSVYPHEIVLVCAHEGSFVLKAHLARLQEELQRQAGDDIEGGRVMIGIGRPGEGRSPQAAHVSYLQAQRTAEQLRLRGDSALLCYDEFETPSSGTVSYFAELLQSLELAILKNEASQVESLIERLAGYLSSNGMSPHMLRSVYLNTASVIFNGLQRFRQDDQSLLRLTDAAFGPRYTLEQMAGILRESGDKLCEIIRETVPQSRMASREELLAALEELGMDPNCSLQLMAEYFGMSASNFSHHFKKTMGQNFKETLDRLRISQAARLLRESEETLEAIAAQCGYTNLSSFIRAFKKILGKTPGQYRQTYKA